MLTINPQRSIEEKAYRSRRFANKYTRKDIELLAEVDEAHETLSGPATRTILYRECHEFGDNYSGPQNSDQSIS